MITVGLHRIAGTFRHRVLKTVGSTIKGVVYGIIGTAIWQGVVAGFGFWLAGVPSALFLGLLTFFLSPIPVGPPIVWIASAIWLFNKGMIGWAIFILIWGIIPISSGDNLIRAYLISKNSNAPFILILLGVIGGVIYFGFIGIFLGPVLLSIGYNMLMEFFLRNGANKIRKQTSPTQ
ncbi:MAG TPA: AI-2E family transporter [Victivallales bacterium]|nr:AI-2E family transporter [Victivallales bacterium]